MNEGFSAPSIEYSLLAPVLIVLGAAVIGVLVEAFAPRRTRYWAQLGVAGLGMVAAFVLTLTAVADRLSGDNSDGYITIMGSMSVDGPAVFVWALLLVLGLLSLMLFAEKRLDGGVLPFAGQASALPGTEAERQASARGMEHTEVFPLLSFAVAGMMIFPAANDLITLFVALEVFSLPLYLLCGLARRRRLLSQEAAMKYFLLGAFSSAFMVYGIALVYGYAGSMGYAQIATAVANDVGNDALLLGGIGMIAVAMLFKVGAAPFHSWTPDVYQGAPTVVTAFMAAATKVAAFGALLRLFYVAFGGARWDWLPMMYVVAILTMLVGSVLALAQTDVKRLLAYSSIAHAGFLLVGFLGIRDVAGAGIGPVQAVLFYLTTYGFTTLAAFGLVTLVRNAAGETNQLSAWAGLGKVSPLVAGLFAFLLLAMAGIPLTSGFTGKWAVFTSALGAGGWPATATVVAAVLLSAVAAAFYIRIIRLMFFTEPEGEGPAVAVPSVLTSTVIGVGTAMTLLLGIVPGPLLDLLGSVSQFIR